MGGCSFGSAGSVCWGDWWVPVVFLGFVLLLAIAVVAGIISILRNPKDAYRYYSSKRNLVVLPLTFLGYMAAWLFIEAVLSETHAPLWVSLLAGILPLSILVFGLRAGRRSPPAP